MSDEIKVEPVETENSIEENITQEELVRKLEVLKGEQNLPLAVIGALIASIIGAVIWAVITGITEYQIGWMAVGVGFLVGKAVGRFGKGIDNIYGIIGAGFSLFGCLSGNLLTVAYFASVQEGVSLPLVILGMIISPSIVFSVIKETFNFMDILFYGLALYEGYKFSFRKITDEVLLNTKVSRG